VQGLLPFFFEVIDDVALGRAALAVPGPIAGAGLPAVLGLAGAWFVRRRKQKLAAYAQLQRP
jgi:LPXTG-motif cell wall-anchored protein